MNPPSRSWLVWYFEQNSLGNRHHLQWINISSKSAHVTTSFRPWILSARWVDSGIPTVSQFRNPLSLSRHRLLELSSVKQFSATCEWAHGLWVHPLVLTNQVKFHKNHKNQPGCLALLIWFLFSQKILPNRWVNRIPNVGSAWKLIKWARPRAVVANSREPGCSLAGRKNIDFLNGFIGGCSYIPNV